MTTSSRLRISFGALVCFELAGPSCGPDSRVSAHLRRHRGVSILRRWKDLQPISSRSSRIEPSRTGRPRVMPMLPRRASRRASNQSNAAAAGDRAHAPKQPPAPIAERPSGMRPQPRAEWVPGYWDWDPARAEFVWMGGIWQVPPPGTIWVGSRWMRDGDGWYRRPGFWSRRREAAVAAATTFADGHQPAWRTTGPPADHPPTRWPTHRGLTIS